MQSDSPHIPSSGQGFLKTPPLLLGASLVLWGLCINWPTLGLLLALAIEAPRLFTARLALGDMVLRRIVDLVAVLTFVAFVLMVALTESGEVAYFTFILWLPVLLYPIMAAQAYGALGGITLGALFYRYRVDKKSGRAGMAVDVGPYYAATCVLAAAAGNVRASWFYPASALLLLLALLPSRSRRHATALSIAMLLACLAAGYYAQHGLLMLEDAVINMEERFRPRQDAWDPSRSETRIGTIGRIKLSDEIVLRVEASNKTLPLYLAKSTYDAYRKGVWRSTGLVWSGVDCSAETGRCALGPEEEGPASSRDRLSVYATLNEADRMIALPGSTTTLTGPFKGAGEATLSINAHGSVRSAALSGFVKYDVEYGGGGGQNPPVTGLPAASDLKIYEYERETVERFIKEQGLDKLPEDELPGGLMRAFNTGFKYSLDLKAHIANQSDPLGEFLFKRKTGHCEYYATASVLVLRGLGIPARYVTGYMVDATDKSGGLYLVRGQSAHAWVLAWLGGRWRLIDTTPASWTLEKGEASVLASMSDMLSNMVFILKKGHEGLSVAERRRLTLGGAVAVALLALLFVLGRTGWRWMFGWALARGADKRAGVAEENMEDLLPTAFDGLSQRLGQRHAQRLPWQTPREWVAALLERGELEREAGQWLERMVEAHYECRFGPRQRRAEARQRLLSMAREFEARFAAMSAGAGR